MFTEKQLIYKIIRNVVQGLATLILAMIVIGILSSQISNISNSIYENERLSQILQRRNENLNYLKQDLDRVGKLDQSIEAAFPDSDDILDFVSNMETLAIQHSMTQTLRFGGTSPVVSPNENFALSTIEYSLNLTGNINYLINYLKAFEKMPYFTRISAINMSSPNGWLADSQIGAQAKLYLRIK